ncbi:3-oxoacyl-[acyl-carrier protein] reductase [Variovorax boronicumulans]|uniref:3-oxoacyl-[acyl-carrier protein] reductase n=1 Tax=Variovorax boronicumulans TaxID=436515 RepID=A0AAW8CUU9_9BURK|nr:3-oxoacyl-ACP reductase family protein [Variovorax boronicumulans]MDP9891528.1 3-oxoacyl-[acyl-carrier protein] reductase [Variovorax boronicumulans]MDQ0051596.1 3-oxoacyl-[acyl-carrier protein] reductase [Variovorax boronicumulans]
MSETLSGKAALVTGGSRGIGAAIVRRLAKDGAAVAFTYAASEEKAKALEAEIASQGGKVLAIKADSADAQAVQQAVSQTVKAFGRLDVLVNSAGILIHGMAENYALADFDRMVAVNVRAVFVATQAAVPHMREGGRVITIGSVTADRSGFAGSSVYSMTKGAVASLTRGLARDLGPRGITVNVVQPGPTDTDMSPQGEIGERVRSLIALGRMGKDSEIASLVAYLAGPDAGFVTGAALTADGGYLA